MVAHEAHFAAGIVESITCQFHDVWTVARGKQGVYENQLELDLTLVCGAEEEDPVEVLQCRRWRRTVERRHDMLR
jgi:hypothetical protein